MDFENNVQQIICKAMNGNSLNLDQGFLAHLKESDKVSLKPLKNKKAVGALLYYEIQNDKELTDVDRQVQLIFQHCKKHPLVTLAGNEGTKKFVTQTIYFYND